MGMLATIAKPEYNNIISKNPTGSAYAWSASTGVLEANFADTIGTTDSIQIFTQGYQFAWKPDTVNVIDDAGNLTLLDNVNPNATAQVWQNKVTYVGTTASTSDEFEVQGNQLKHSVRMVAPPILPDGFAGTPQYLAIGGDIGTTADDWAAIDLWADGTTHLADFTTSDDLKFCLKSDGSEVYRIPHITVTDDAGNEASGQYQLVFGANNEVTMYMLVPWDWIQQAQYPIVIDPTVIVSGSYDTGGNGGRKVVRLSNNWIVVAIKNTSTSPYYVYFYVSKDNGQTWAQLCYWSAVTASLHDVAIASSGTIVYALDSRSAGSNYFKAFDATTVTNTALTGSQIVDTQSSISGGCSIAFDGNGNLHATWSSENSSYPNSFNIRYSKGTVSGTTVSWATPTQITIANVSGVYTQNPCIVIQSNNNPIIIAEHASSSSTFNILSYTYNGSSWGTFVPFFSSDSSYAQQNPCAAIDSNGTIHVVWHGEDSTYTATYNIKYSKSTNGGSTWSTPMNLTTVSTSGNHQWYPTITVDPDNNLYVFFQGHDSSVSSYWNIRYVKYTASSGTWNSPTTITSDTTNNALNPSALWSEFNMNSSDALRAIYTDSQANAVEYYTITFDQPPLAPTLGTVSGFDATKAETLSWTFNPGTTGDTQSAYQLQIVNASTQAVVYDSGKVASVTSSMTLPANTLTNGTQYQWRVNTWNNAGMQGTYSPYGTFTCAAAPTVTITSPAAGATLNGSAFTAQWSYSDPAGNAQQSFDVQLLDATDGTVLWDSGTVNGSGNQYTVQYTLANNTSYHLKVTATNSKGITSAASDIPFTVSYAPPAQATVTVTPNNANGYHQIAITNPAPSGSEPTVASNTISRRITGTTAWAQIATQVPTNATYDDYIVASGVQYDYKVTANGSNGTQIDSAVESASLTFTGDWVYNPASGQQFQFLYNRKAYTLGIQEERQEVQTFGTKPMVRRGPLNARQGTLDALMVKVDEGLTPIQQLQALEADMAPHNPYYLKTAAGEVYKVDLYNVQRNMPTESLNPYAIEVSVNWTEIA